MAVIHKVPYEYDGERYIMPSVFTRDCMECLSGIPSVFPFHPAWAPFNSYETWHRKFQCQRPLTPRDRLFIITIMKAAIKKQMEDN